MQVKVYITLILILVLHTFPDLSLFYLASDSQKYPHQSSDLQHLIHLTKKGLLHFERLYLNVVYSLWLKWSSLSSQGTMPCCVLSVTRTALLNTPVVLATTEQCLHIIKAFLFVTQRVGKDLGGNRGSTADTNQLKGYSILCIFMLRDKNLGVGDGTFSSIAIAQSGWTSVWSWNMMKAALYPPSFTFELSLPWPRHFPAFILLLCPPAHCRRQEQEAVWVLNCWVNSDQDL